MHDVSARSALQALRTGNERFVAAVEGRREIVLPGDPRDLALGQRPFAVVLGCSDSRVPPEAVFGQGFGDLFVVRVAGNVVSPEVLDSIDLSIDAFATPLVVVLGHSGCAAVAATVDIELSASQGSPRLTTSLVEGIRPAVAPLLSSETATDRERLLRRAVRANVAHVVEALRERLRTTEGTARVAVVGAEYSLDELTVDFFCGVDEIEYAG